MRSPLAGNTRRWGRPWEGQRKEMTLTGGESGGGGGMGGFNYDHSELTPHQESAAPKMPKQARTRGGGNEKENGEEVYRLPHRRKYKGPFSKAEPTSPLGIVVSTTPALRGVIRARNTVLAPGILVRENNGARSRGGGHWLSNRVKERDGVSKGKGDVDQTFL